MSPDHSGIAEVIEKATGLQIHSCKTLKSFGNHVVEVNDEWIFRFPIGRPSADRTQKQLNFLAAFAKRSPLAIPEPVFITGDFVGYRKIGGEPFFPGNPFDATEIDRLPAEDKKRIAKQVGVFLATLHDYRDNTIDWETGWFAGKREGGEPSDAQCFVNYLSAGEYRRLVAKREAIENNPANFVQPATIIHNDLYFLNILWDRTSRTITGILDWSEMGLGIPALDFIGIADFATSRNDQFLRDIVRWYGAGDTLFNQIKENAIIEVMNWFWFYEHTNDPEGAARTITRLKNILNT